MPSTKAGAGMLSWDWLSSSYSYGSALVLVVQMALYAHRLALGHDLHHQSENSNRIEMPVKAITRQSSSKLRHWRFNGQHRSTSAAGSETPYCALLAAAGVESGTHIYHRCDHFDGNPASFSDR